MKNKNLLKELFLHFNFIIKFKICQAFFECFLFQMKKSAPERTDFISYFKYAPIIHNFFS